MDHIILKLEGTLEIQNYSSFSLCMNPRDIKWFVQSLKISWEWACNGTWVFDAQYFAISIKLSDWNSSWNLAPGKILISPKWLRCLYIHQALFWPLLNSELNLKLRWINHISCTINCSFLYIILLLSIRWFCVYPHLHLKHKFFENQFLTTLTPPHKAKTCKV